MVTRGESGKSEKGGGIATAALLPTLRAKYSAMTSFHHIYLKQFVI